MSESVASATSAPAEAQVRIVVTGAAGFLGSRVAERLHAGGHTVVAVDRVAAAPGATRAGEAIVRLDLAHAPLTAVFDGADAVVHLAGSFPVDAVSLDGAKDDLDLLVRVLDHAATAGARHVLVLSTAMVYGAWPTNPIPITEDAPVRPNPEFAFAVRSAELERRALDWRRAHPAVGVAVLRPTVIVADNEPSRVAQLLRQVGAIRTDEDPPAQFLHVDDLVAAVAVATTSAFDGVLNVAADGWIRPEMLNALMWNRPRPRVSRWVLNVIAELRWKSGLASAPPGIVPYTVYPWVVANDRLRSLGWQPSNTNEEAFVAAHDAGPLGMLNARRRQQLALGATGGVLAGIAGGLGWLVLRHRRR